MKMKRYFSLALSFLLFLSVIPFAYADSYGSADLARNGVVRVCIEGDVQVYYGNTLQETIPNILLGHGSAFAVGEKGKPVSYFITNRHVVSEEAESLSEGDLTYLCTPKTFYIVLDNEATLYPIDIITDNNGGADLSIIKLKEPTTQREALILNPYEDAASLSTSTVYSVGFPGSQTGFLDENHQNASGVDMVSVRKGSFDHEIDKLHSAEKGSLILTDVPMSTGNSGGPLVDEKGGVLGICTYGSIEDSGMSAAISVNEAIPLLQENNIPYETVHPPVKEYRTWIAYGILGLAIIAVFTLLVIVLRKKSSKQVPMPELGPKPIPIPNPNLQAAMPPHSLRTLVGVCGPLEGKRYIIKAGESIYVGRDTSKCRVVFQNGTPGVGRIHCIITFDGTTATITDLDSRYGTFVDQKRLAPNTPVPLHRGLSIDIGSPENRFSLQ
jgi:hypothetical protein